jgi:glycosyltransferase involved in cell wall biosynthesis
MLSSVASMIDQFNMSNINILKNLGYEVHVLANFQDPGTITQDRADKLKVKLNNMDVKIYDVDMHRNPASKENWLAYKIIRQIIETEKYDLIHCHSPIGGVLARLAANKSREQFGTKVIYTAHGFHFFKGGPLKDWVVFYPIERYLSRYTDVLITINQVDSDVASKLHMKNLEYIPGVGLDTHKFETVAIDIKKKREMLGIPHDAFVILSVGELSARKNHQVIINALHKLNNSKIYYLICGKGEKENELMEMIREYGLDNHVFLLGYRSDIDELNQIADVSAFPSRREGLGIAGLEAMAAGLPILTSNVQGIPDYSIAGVTGFNYDPMDTDGFANGIKTLFDDPALAKQMGSHNRQAVKKYDIENVNKVMRRIYSDISSR